MLYYTQLVYVIEGQEDTFYAFEDQVLPLLAKHNGELLYRVRSAKEAVVTTSIEHPHEIHLVSFPNRIDFEGYRDDPQRQQYLGLKNRSISKSVLIEGKAL